MADPEGINYLRLYEYRFRGIDQGSRQRVWAEIAADIYRRMGSPERVLDPAAGRCEFINAIPAQERWVVDIVDHAEFRDPEIKAVFSDILSAELPEDYFDGVFVSNFLEHLPTQDAVAEVLNKLNHSMKSGGTIAVLGPNFRYTSKSYFDCADHTIALTHIAVAEHLAAAGFTVSKIIPRFLPYSFRGHLPSAPQLVRLYLKVPWAWRVLGKQFLLTATKP